MTVQMTNFVMQPERLAALLPILEKGPLLDVHFSAGAVLKHGFRAPPGLAKPRRIDLYDAYQREHVNTPETPSGAFHLVRFLAGLNDPRYLPSGFSGIKIAPNFHLASMNNYDAGERVENSLQHFGIPYETSRFSNGMAPLNAIAAKTGQGSVFLSTEAYSHESCQATGVVALKVHDLVVNNPDQEFDQLMAVLDWDATVAFDHSEQIFQKLGKEAFSTHERLNLGIPMGFGFINSIFWYLNLVRTLFATEDLQSTPLINTILTARDGESMQRVRTTIRHWVTGNDRHIHFDLVEGLQGSGLSGKGGQIKSYVADQLHTTGLRVLPVHLDDGPSHAESSAANGVLALQVPRQEA